MTAKRIKKQVGKVIALVITIIIITIAIATWINYNDAKVVLNEYLVQQQISMCNEIAEKLTSRFKRSREFVKIISTLPIARAGLQPYKDDLDCEHLVDYLDQLTGKVKEFQYDENSILIVDAKGKITAHGLNSQQKKLVEPIIDNILQAQNNEGIYINPITKVPELYFIKAIINESNSTIGHVILFSDTRIFDQLFYTDSRSNLDLRMSVISKDNQVLASSNYALKPGEYITNTPVYNILSSKNQTLFSYTFKGERLGSFITMSGGLTDQWKIILTSNKNASYATIDKLSQHLLQINLIMAIVLVIIIAIVLRYLLRDIIKSQDKLALVINGAEIPTWEWDLKTHSFFTNSFTNRLFGINPSQNGNMVNTFFEKVHLDDIENLKTQIGFHLLSQDALINEEFRVILANEVHWLKSIGKAVAWNKQGEPTRLAGIFIDIHAQKEAYQSQLNYTKLLEEQVIKRTAELKASMDQAMLANKAKGDFLANMSHEIRTPLNGIIGLLYLTMQTSLNNIQQDYINKAELTAKKLLAIINDILDISKIEADKIILESLPFKIRPLIQEAVSIVQPDSKNATVQINIVIDNNIPEIIEGDELRLNQILNNLLSNAIKFTHDGYINIEVKLVNTQNETLILEFNIEDSGIGMSQEQLDKIFSAFTQADNSISRKYGGTGLGLIISRRLVEIMGGNINVSSRLNYGTKFSFTAKFKTCSQTSERSNKTKALSAQDMHLFKNITILLAEDNEINQIIATEILQQHGCKVEVANDGVQAIEMLNATKYDIILMDIQMPKLDGLEAAKQIRKNPNFDNIPIIAMTAHAMQEDYQKSLAAGMQDHISKPIDPMHMCAVVIRWHKVKLNNWNIKTK